MKSFSIKSDNLNIKEKETISCHFINQRFDYVTVRQLQKKIENDTSLTVLNKLPWIEILLN